MENENLSNVLLRLSEKNAFYDTVQEECRLLSEDPELKAFIEQVLQDGVVLIQMIWDESNTIVPTGADSAVSEEAAP